MTTARTILTRVRAASIGVSTLTQRVDAALANIKAERDALDGFKSTASGADVGPRGNSNTSSTERAAIARLSGKGEWTEVTTPYEVFGDLTTALTHIIDLIHNECNHWTKTRTLEEEAVLNSLRCIGTGNPDGSTCTQFATDARSDGRCLDCGPKWDAAKKADKARRERLRYQRASS
jgi:hypothetical protein